MVTTRSGKVIKYRPEDYGRYYNIFGRKPSYKSITKRLFTRSQINKLPSLPTWRVPDSPVSKERDISRLRASIERPSCSDYGQNRRLQFPGYFFCSECDFWDLSSFDPISSSRNKRTSTTFACYAKHASWVMPTEKLDLNKNDNNNKSTNDNKNKHRLSPQKNDAIYYSDDDSFTEYYSEKDEMEELHEIESDKIMNYKIYEEEVKLLEQEFNTLKFNNQTLVEDNNKLQERYKLMLEKHSLSINNQSNKIQECESRMNEYKKENDYLMEQLKVALETSEKFEKANMNLMEKIASVTETNRKLSKKIYKYSNKQKSEVNDYACPTSNIYNLTTEEVTRMFLFNLEILSHQKNRNIKTMLELVSKMLFQPEIFDGQLLTALIRSCQEYYRRKIFSPENLLKLMDQRGGHLSMTAIALLRTLETNNNKYSRSSMFPSSTTIKRTCYKVDEVAMQLVPFTLGVLDNGAEFARFKVDSLVRLLLKGHGLEAASKKRPVRLNMAIDGSKITTRLHHVTLGLKIADYAACDPTTGELIYGSSDKTTLQSKYVCFPVMIIMAQETKKIYDYLREPINEIKDLTIPEIAAEKLDGAKAIEALVNTDMSGTWKVTGIGHAVKHGSGEGQPCHVCPILDRNLEKPNNIKCDGWCKELHKDDADWKCYHQEFLDEDCVKAMKLDLETVKEELKDILQKFELIQKKTKLNVKEDPRTLSSELQLNDNTSIHFDIEKHKDNKGLITQFASAIRQDLKLRDMCVDGEISECRDRLKITLVQEFNYRRLLSAINHVHGFSSDKSYILLAECPPCILHMEMRTVLKFLQIILDDGLREAITDKESIDNYMQKINLVFNEQIFGTKERPYTFKATYDSSKKLIDDITLDGLRCRVLIYNFQPLIETCVKKIERRNKWLFIVEHYIKSFKLLRKKEDLTQDEIKQFQYHVDLFFQMYMDLTQRRGITNYFHMMGSGHVADYLIRCGNLYIHSQQGWEAFNSFLKVFYFRRTSRGGGRGSQNNRIRDLARWSARRVVWNSGLSYDEILAMYNLGIASRGKAKNEKDNDEEEYNIHEDIPLDAELYDNFNPDYYIDDLDDEAKESPVESAPTFYKGPCKNHPGSYKIQYGHYYNDKNYCIDCVSSELPFVYYF